MMANSKELTVKIMDDYECETVAFAIFSDIKSLNKCKTEIRRLRRDADEDGYEDGLNDAYTIFEQHALKVIYLDRVDETIEI